MNPGFFLCSCVFRYRIILSPHTRHTEEILSPAVSVQSVIFGINQDVSSCNINGDSFQPFIAGQHLYGSAFYINRGFGMNPVISCRDDQFPVSEAEAVIHMDSILNSSNV